MELQSDMKIVAHAGFLGTKYLYTSSECVYHNAIIRIVTASSKKTCLNELNAFCYICGEYTCEHKKKPVNDSI